MNRHSIARTLSIALIAVPLAAAAQGPAPTAPQAAPAAAPAPAAPVSPEQRAAIKDLLDAMNTHDALTRAYAAMSQGLAPRMGEAMNRQIETNPSLSPEQKQRVRASIGPSFETAVRDSMAIVTSPQLVDETIDRMIPIYAKYFTLPEIKQLTAFYRTPLGQKTLATMSQANGEALQAGAAIFSPRISAIMEKTVRAQVDAVTAAAPAPGASKGSSPAKK